MTASRQRFVMLHDVKNEDGIKSFFSEMYEVSTAGIRIRDAQNLDSSMLTLESRCIPAVLGGVHILRNLPNHQVID